MAQTVSYEFSTSGTPPEAERRLQQVITERLRRPAGGGAASNAQHQMRLAKHTATSLSYKPQLVAPLPVSISVWPGRLRRENLKVTFNADGANGETHVTVAGPVGRGNQAGLAEALLGLPGGIWPNLVAAATSVTETGARPLAEVSLGPRVSAAPAGHLIAGNRHTRDQTAADKRGVRVLLAASEKLLRAGLRELLKEGTDIAVVGEAASGRETVALASQIHPDVVLMSFRLPGMDGAEATRRITTHPELSDVRVLILFDDERDEKNLFEALRAGASALMTRDTDPAELLRAVRVLADGGVELSPTVTRCLVDYVCSQPLPERSTPELLEELTVREREAVALVAQGLTNHEIAQRLVMSPATAKTHVTRAMVKLHVHDRAKLVALAYQTGFAPSPG